MHTQKGHGREGGHVTTALCRRQTGGHIVTALKTRITEERHPGSRISQAKAHKRELVMCGTGKQAGLAEEKNESSKVLRQERGARDLGSKAETGL